MPCEFCTSRLALAAGILDRRRKLLNRAPGLGHQRPRSSGLRANKEEPHENTNCDQNDNYRNVMMLNAAHGRPSVKNWANLKWAALVFV
jgi:hypothetical protein